MSNLDVAVASFWQLARHWKKGDQAKLELSCEGESLHIKLSAVLGHPDHPHFPDPTNVSPTHKKKSPSQLRRHERRRQEAILKAAKDKVLEEDSPEEAKKHSEHEVEVNSISSKETIFKCKHCEVNFKTDKGLKIHVGKAHKSVLLPTPEKERSDFTMEEPPLALTPDKVARGEEEVEDTPVILEDCELKEIKSSSKVQDIEVEETVKGIVQETQTDVFLKVDDKNYPTGPSLDLLYDEPPPSVYHPTWGVGKYHATEVYTHWRTKEPGKTYCYRFEDGSLADI